MSDKASYTEAQLFKKVSFVFFKRFKDSKDPEKTSWLELSFMLCNQNLDVINKFINILMVYASKSLSIPSKVMLVYCWLYVSNSNRKML